MNNYNHRNIDLIRKVNTLNNFKDVIPFIIKKTIKYINDNVRNPIEINGIVELTRWEKHHFLRFFAKYVGETLYQYILKRKIDIARSILIEIDNQIIDNAYEIGFNNHLNFSIRFKKITGYRQKILEKLI